MKNEIPKNQLFVIYTAPLGLKITIANNSLWPHDRATNPLLNTGLKPPLEVDQGLDRYFGSMYIRV